MPLNCFPASFKTAHYPELRRSEAALQIAYDEIKTLKDELRCNGHAQRIAVQLVGRAPYVFNFAVVGR